MSRPKKDKPADSGDEPEVEEASKPVPWACEIEFYGKPSFMSAITHLTVDNERVSLVRADGSIMAFPYESVNKVLIMHTTVKNPVLD